MALSSTYMTLRRRGWGPLALGAMLAVPLLALPADADSRSPQPQPSTSATPAPPPNSSFQLNVPGDRPIDVVLGPADSPVAMIYLHGYCGDPHAYRSWASAAATHGTLISLRADIRCDDNPRRSHWSYNFDRHLRRIDKAMDAVDAFRAAMRDSTTPVPLDRQAVTLIGYSQGAMRAQSLAARYPKRFPQVALIAIATEPSVTKLYHTDRVLLMAGARDARQHIRDGYAKLRKANRTAHYLELPGAGHGEYGPQAQQAMGKGLDWLFKKVP